MNANIGRGALALAGLAMALFARPVSAGAAQDHKPKHVVEKVVPVYNSSAGSQRGRIFLLEDRSRRITGAAENFQDTFNIDY